MMVMMARQPFNFLPILFILILSSTLIQPSKSSIVYHGKNRFWTVVHDEKTYFALHQFQGDTKVIFPNQTTFPLIQTYTTPNRTGHVSGTLIFKFIINDDVNHMRYLKGEILTENGNLKVFLYQECPEEHEGRSFGPAYIDKGGSLELKNCFIDGNIPFAYYDETRNAMDFRVTGSIGCPVFLVLPKEMILEEIALENATRLPLNTTIAEKEDWWKAKNDAFLPTGVKFDNYHNVLFDIIKMNSSEPVYLRIGQHQPIPTFQFSFDITSCSDLTFDLYMNDNLDHECRIGFKIASNGFLITTKGSENSLILDSSLSPSLVFDTEAVYVKTHEPVSISRFDTCKIINHPADHLTLRISNIDSGICDKAELLLLNADVESDIEILVDREKLPINIPAAASNHVLAETPSKKSNTNDASFPWYFIAIIIVAVLLIVILIVVLVLFMIRRQRQKKKNEKQPVKLDRKKKKELKVKGGQPYEMKTAIPKNPDETSKPEKPESEQTERSRRMNSLRERMKKRKEEEDAENGKPIEEPKTPRLPGFGKVHPIREKADSIPINDPMNDPTPEARSTQEETVEDKQPTISKEGKPSKLSKQNKLKQQQALPRCFLYGGNGAPVNEPFDYHAGESATFETALQMTSSKTWSTPDLKNFQNFWDCVKGVAEPKRFSAVYINAKLLGKNVFFMVRDLVADEERYAPFQSLSNRMLEPLQKKLKLGDDTTTEEATVDGQKKYCLLRIFILSYEPLTLEIHCRGPCPLFLFSLFECEDCPDIEKELQRNAFLFSSGTCRDDWEKFVCRVKRTPMNSHQYLSYNGGEKPTSSDDINHILVIRGDKKPKKLRPCIRGCKFSDASHPNQFTFESNIQLSGTLATQETQNSTS